MSDGYKMSALSAAIAVALGLGGVNSFASSDDFFALEEVVVTAQKRQETLQDVPIAISAFDSDFLDRSNITNIADLAVHTPGFSSSVSDPTTPQIYMRGIGTNDFGVASDPSVGMFIDGIYFGRFGGAISDLDNIQTIEVLKGPQGTLFGRNTIGGAISITTRKPSNDTEADVSAGVGNFGLASASASFSTALVEDSVYVSGFVKRAVRDGWQTNLASDRGDGANRDNASGKLNFTWYPSEELEVTFRNDWSRTDENFGYQKALSILGQDNIVGANAALQGIATLAGYLPATVEAVALDPINFDLGETDTNVAGGISEFDRRLRGHSLSLTYELSDNYSLTSLTAYREYKLKNATPSGVSNNLFSVPESLENVETYSQEFRLNGHFDDLDWFVGVSVFREDATSFKRTSGRIVDPTSAAAIAAGYGVAFAPFYGFDESSQGHNRTDSYAIYGDVTWHLTDQWSVSAGLRYTRDEKEFTLTNPGFVGATLDPDPAMAASGILIYQNLGILFPANLSGLGTVTEQSSQDDWTNVSGRLVASYDLSEDVQLYASVSQGFKSGGFNTFPGINLTTGQVSNSGFDPELVLSYELGAKAQLMNSRLRVNSALFQYNYEDLQVLTSDPNSNAGVILNAGEATGTGVEVDITFLATENLRVMASLAWLDAEYDDFRISDTLNLKGQELNRAPKFSGSIGIDYSVPLDVAGEVRVNANYAYTGEQRYQATLDHQPLVQDSDVATEDSYGLLSAKISYQSADALWKVSIWGNNLTDEDYLAERGSAAQGLGYSLGRLAEPRTYGLDIRYAY